MLWTPKADIAVVTNGGIVGSASPGTGVPSHAATPDTQGAVTELISAANNVRDSWGIEVFITGTGLAATAAQAKMDILVGGATDDVLIPSLICGYAVSGFGGWRYFFPLHIPAGLRIAAALTSVRTGITARVLCWLYGGGLPPFRVGRKVTAYGTAINGSRGQAVTPTASGGAASVTQMTASSSEDHFAFLPAIQPATDTTVTPTGYMNLGVGLGAATEQRMGTWWLGKDTGENVHGLYPQFPCICDTPAGTRVTLLASNSGANDAAYDGHVYAVS